MPWNAIESGNQATATPPRPVGPSRLDRNLKWLLPLVIATVLMALFPAGYYVQYGLDAMTCASSTVLDEAKTCQRVGENRWLAISARQAAYRQLMTIHKNNGDRQLAIDAFNKLASLMPPTASDFRLLGDVQYDMALFGDAAINYENALKLEPDNDVFLNDIIWTHIKNNDYAAAQKAASRFLIDHSESASAFREAGRAAYFDTKDNLAYELVSVALEKDPNDSESHNLMGLILEDQGHNAAAIKRYDQALAIDKGFASYFTNRARARRLNDDPKGSVSDYLKAIEIYQSAENYTGLALSRIADDEMDLANEAITKALAIDATYVDAYLARAQLSYWQNKNDLARKDAEKALELAPGNARARYRIALIDRETGNLDVALASFRKLQEDWPQDAGLQVQIGHTLVDKEDARQALAVFEKAIEFDAKHADAYDGKSRALLNLKEWESAIALANKAIELNDRDGTYFARRAYGEWGLYQADKAEADYEKAKQLLPKSLWIADEYVRFLATDGNMVNAETEIAALLKQPSPTFEAYRYAGYLADRKQDFAQALTYYKKAHETDPTQDWVLEDLGWSSMDNDHYVAAEDYCSQLIKRRPVAPEGYRCHARALYLLNNENDAIADLTKAIKLDATYRPARFDRGYIYIGQGKNEEAILDFKTLAEADYRSADSYFYLGIAQQNLGNNKAAERSFEHALLTANPDTAREASHRLQMLRSESHLNARDINQQFPQKLGKARLGRALELPRLGNASPR